MGQTIWCPSRHGDADLGAAGGVGHVVGHGELGCRALQTGLRLRQPTDTAGSAGRRADFRKTMLHTSPCAHGTMQCGWQWRSFLIQQGGRQWCDGGSFYTDRSQQISNGRIMTQ